MQNFGERQITLHLNRSTQKGKNKKQKYEMRENPANVADPQQDIIVLDPADHIIGL
jgi:hypothetical protein